MTFFSSSLYLSESIERYSGETDTQKLEGQLTASKRNSAYKRLPGWKVFYGKRSSDVNFGDKLNISPFQKTQHINDLIDSASDGDGAAGIDSAENWDTSDSVNLSDALDSVDNKNMGALDQNANLLDLVRELNQAGLTSDSYNKGSNDEIQDSKRSDWNAIYGKRMPGWFAGYGKRGDDLSNADKRAAQWLAMYGKRSPAWFATYGKRAPQWLATYGKRAPQWLATYGKRAPGWTATYGKRSPEHFASYEKRAPQWLATYGKRAPQWLATYGKRAPGWIATYGKRSDMSAVNAFNRHLSDLHRQFGDNGQVNTMQKEPPVTDDTYDKRANGGWAALYG